MFKTFLKIIFFPIWFPIILLLSIFLFSLSTIVTALGFSFFLIFAALGFIGVLFIFLNTSIFFVNFFTAILGLGVGAILTGFSLLFLILGIKLCTQFIPKFLNGISLIFRKMFGRKKSVNSTKEIVKYE